MADMETGIIKISRAVTIRGTRDLIEQPVGISGSETCADGSEMNYENREGLTT